mmetsp:Transcript_7388/g.17204  ORF Transcript_7388/g.17204 Transcript_7388/m.17204 type:complete len:196 (-) Transcript_7388:488-1075(-)
MSKVDEETGGPRPYLILTNISKRQNVRNLLQLSAAFGCPAVFVVGQPSFEFDPDADGTDVPSQLREGIRRGTMEIVRFDGLDECVAHVKSMDVERSGGAGDDRRRGMPILGVEIDESSVNLESEPFASSTAFMMGNEGSGMSPKQMAACDGFVRISQYGGGTASLNVSVACGLVLHRFDLWRRGERVGVGCGLRR